MTGPQRPLDYQSPHPPDPPRTGRNFALGLLAGVAASGAGWGIAYATGNGNAVFIVLVVLLVGKVGVAVSTARSRRWPGFAPGLLLSFGVALLVAGGLCFAALQHI